MMLKSFFTIALALSTIGMTWAQKVSLTLDDVVAGGINYKNFTPETLKQLQWTGQGETWSFVKDQTLKVKDASNPKLEQTYTVADFATILNDEALTTLPSFRWLSDGELVLFQDKGFSVVNLKQRQSIYSMLLPDDADHQDYDFKNRVVAYTIQNNLYVATASETKIAVTADSNLDIENGQPFHRNEFGVEKGTLWSPNGKLLAFSRNDQSAVGVYPLVNITEREAVAEPIKYPMAGMASEQVTIGIFNVETKHTLFLKTGEPADHYLTNWAWSVDGTLLYVAELNREQNHMQLNAYSVETGLRVSTLFEERHLKYVEPLQPLVWVPNQPDQFVWQSNRDGHNHLYLYRSNGELIRQLTTGAWDVIDFLGFDVSGKTLCMSTTEVSPTQRHTFQLELKTGKMNALTSVHGVHRSLISASGKYMLDIWSNMETPRVIDLVDVKKGSVRNLLTADDPYKNVQLGTSKMVTVTAADDSTLLYGNLIAPANIDPHKKYPVIVYVYGGPHLQQVLDQWPGSTMMWQHYMAQKGYVSFILDNRGSANRGRDFENVIHRQLGVCEMADQMKGVEYLKLLPYVDSTRIGVHGWSFGGFMTTSLMTHHSETFKVGVGGGPVIDWKYYEVMYGERYMDTPQENPDGYEKASLIGKAKDLKGRLLLIHGDIDPTVVWQHSLLFVKACVDAGVPIDYFVYPRHEHNVRGIDRVHLMQKVTQYFDDFL